MNDAVSRPEVFQAIARFMALNSGPAVAETFDFESDLPHSDQAKIENLYKGWLKWVRLNLPETWRVTTKMAKSIRSQEAAV